MTYEKGSLRYDDRYGPFTMHGPEQIYVPKDPPAGPEGRPLRPGARLSDFIIGWRAEAVALTTDLFDVLAKTRTEACVYTVHPDNTLRTQDGNVIAACADRVTAAMLGVLLDRFDMLSGGDDDGPVPFPAWKGPYAS